MYGSVRPGCSLFSKSPRTMQESVDHLVRVWSHRLKKGERKLKSAEPEEVTERAIAEIRRAGWSVCALLNGPNVSLLRVEHSHDLRHSARRFASAAGKFGAVLLASFLHRSSERLLSSQPDGSAH